LAAAAVAGRGAEHDVLGQVLVEGAEAVTGPAADGRERSLADVPAGVELELRPVVVVAGPERADHGEVVGARADVLPPVGDLEAALAVAAEAGAEAHEDLAVAVLGVAGDDTTAVAGEGTLVGRVGETLAGVLGEFGLGVE